MFSRKRKAASHASTANATNTLSCTQSFQTNPMIDLSNSNLLKIDHDRPSGSRRPSSIIHNVIETPEEHQHHSGPAPRSGPAAHFPKIFSKEGVRNALFLNSAATAFTKSTRSNDMEMAEMPLSYLAIAGSAIPALWMRRDDKGRRPVSIVHLSPLLWRWPSVWFLASCPLV